MTPGALDAAWARIVDEHGADEAGVVPIGGAALIRVNDREAEAISGGEDALDSLEWAVNEVLGEVLEGAEVLVVAEERALVTDADEPGLGVNQTFNGPQPVKSLMTGADVVEFVDYH